MRHFPIHTPHRRTRGVWTALALALGLMVALLVPATPVSARATC